MTESGSSTSPAPIEISFKGGLGAAQRIREGIIEGLLFLAGISSVLITVGIVVVLLHETIPFFGWHAATLHASELGAGQGTVGRLFVQPGDQVTQGTPLIEITREGGEAVTLVAKQFTRINQVPVAAGDAVTKDSDLLKIDHTVRFRDFFGQKMWAPGFDMPAFGIWSLIMGTLVTTFVALAVAIPAGTISAIWLSEYCNPGIREIVKPALELLAAVPTVVYGYFALLIVTPILQKLLGTLGISLPGFNMLSAGMVMGVMIIPYVASLSEDAMRAVPTQMREGSYATGATRFQTAVRVLIPSALSGITAAYILAISRAVGETMIVAVAAGLQPNFTADPTESAATISAAIVQAVLGDVPHDSTPYRAIFAAGLVLLLMTLFFNIAGYILRKRYREAY